MAETVIEVRNICKTYGSVRALDKLSFQVSGGEICALLGPNGAGKTTALAIMEGLSTADSGSIAYFGREIQNIGNDIKRRIGVQLQSTAFFPFLRVEEILRMFGGLYPQAIDTAALISRFSLEEKRKALAKTLSGGQTQRLALACAMVNNPEIVFLDEPTTGLDTQSRLNLWDAIRSLRAEGRTVVLTTHYMDEAEALADKVVIIDHGILVAQGHPRELIQSHSANNLESLFLMLTGHSLRE